MAKAKEMNKPAELPDAVKAQSDADAPGAPNLDMAALLGDVSLSRSTQPGMLPPGEVAEAADAGITAWQTGKKISATWSNSSNRNAYVAIPGIGWKKISNANDSSFLSMVMMAAHAEQTNSTVNVEIGTDQEIHQIYVW